MAVFCDVCYAKGTLKLIDKKSDTGNKLYPVPKKVIKDEKGVPRVADFYYLDLCDQCIIDIMGYGGLTVGIKIEGLILSSAPKPIKVSKKEIEEENPIKAETRKNANPEPVSEVQEK